MFAQRVYEMNGQQARHPESTIEGFGEHISVLTNRIFERYASLHFSGAQWLNLLLFLVGMAFLILLAIKYVQGHEKNPFPVAFLLVGGAASLPALFTPLDWDRYYLFPVFFSTLAIAIAIWKLACLVYHRIHRGGDSQAPQAN